MSLVTKVKLLDPQARLPKRAHDSDTGYDLQFTKLKTIKGDTLYFSTGISIEPPEGYYFEVVPRSSISEHPLVLANSIGVIDAHYRGEILVALKVLHSKQGDNVGRESFAGGITSIFGLKPQSLYDVAQLIIQKKPSLVQLILRKREDCAFEEVVDLSQTRRGTGGFGSTDINTPMERAPTQEEMLAFKQLVKEAAQDKDFKMIAPAPEPEAKADTSKRRGVVRRSDED